MILSPYGRTWANIEPCEFGQHHPNPSLLEEEYENRRASWQLWGNKTVKVEERRLKRPSYVPVASICNQCYILLSYLQQLQEEDKEIREKSNVIWG